MPRKKESPPSSLSPKGPYLLEKILTGILLILGVGIAAYGILFVAMYFL